jgi:hypothetical protein
MSSILFIDDNNCIVTTNETYKIQNNEEPLHLRTLRGKYELEKRNNSDWKIKNFADKFKIVSKINY